MTFRKSLTTLAAVALIAFAVTMAQAGSCGTPCPSKAQAGCQHEMKAQGCGHGAMKAEGCGSSCKHQGMAGGCKGQMQKSDCCMGMAHADCCKNKMMRGGCGMSCEKMMMQGCCGMCSKQMMKGGCGGDGCKMDQGCKWECNGIWGDYDCSNPGGRSLFNCRSKDHCDSDENCRIVIIRCDDDDDEDEDGSMMWQEKGCGGGGPRMVRIERREYGGQSECQVRVMQHRCDASCKSGCKMMQQGAKAPCGGAPAAQAPQGGCPHSGK
jgi:hypothetical protein